jgi:hypothetical protein
MLLHSVSGGKTDKPGSCETLQQHGSTDMSA